MEIREKNYDFRKRHFEVHKKGRRVPERLPEAGEILVDAGWTLIADAGPVTENAVGDLQDYFSVSMETPVSRGAVEGRKEIRFSVDPSVDRGFILRVSPEGADVLLARDRDAFRASVYIEDVMSLRGLPVLPSGETVRRQLFDYRDIHSGCGVDEFPDEELRAIVHAGYDALSLFVTGPDHSSVGHVNINDLIERAARFGIEVNLFNYITTFIHPDDPGAQEVFDRAYGDLFRKYPGAAGIGLGGESLEFPSKDPHVTGKLYSESVVDGIPDTRPSTSWYPCYDYPAYIQCIERAVHKVKPEARVIFSTYNWAYLDAERRAEFLRHFPENVMLSVVYENENDKLFEGLRTPVMDYTMSVTEPGYYFRTECAEAKKNGIPVQGNVNTAGIAWDFGCVPYVPAPYKLIRRLRNLRTAHDEWGVISQYATHHYGYWNCVASDLGKWASWEDFEPDYDKLLRAIAVRDYGEDAADAVLAAWKALDDAMDYYVASNEDQYGPWRVGAAYPFIFHPDITRTMVPKDIRFPTHPDAKNGWRIIQCFYRPFENDDQAPGFLRYPAELRALEKMEALWVRGTEILNKEAEKESANAELLRFRALAQFILCAIRTVIHVKNWWILNMKLQNASSQEEGLAILGEIKAIADEEEKNVMDCYPGVELDSRLGWEASMEYVCDPWHLDWKRRQLDAARREIEQYRKIIVNAYGIVE